MKILLLRTHNESFCLCTFHDLPRKQQQLSEIQYTPRNARPSSIQKNEEFTNHPQTSKKEIRRTTSKESSNLTKTFRSNSESPQDTRTSTHKQRARPGQKSSRSATIPHNQTQIELQTKRSPTPGGNIEVGKKNRDHVSWGGGGGPDCRN